MQVEILEDAVALGRAAAEAGAAVIREALTRRDRVDIIVATGASQFDMLEVLTTAPGIDWSRVTAFHLDEYIGLPVTHGASFRRYLHERFVARLPALGQFVDVVGDAPDIAAELARLNGLIGPRTIEVCFAGIGENGHLAFNDPPADFATTEPYIVVDLDEACRRQQIGEGWFPDMAAVPRQAISMSIRQMLAARTLIITVPGPKKTAAVAAALDGPLTPDVPASILRQHADCRIFLDPASSAGLKR